MMKNYKIRLFTHLSNESYSKSEMQKKLKSLQDIYGKENVSIVKTKKK